MKEVFQLIVSSFESLHDMASRSYTKRTSILETVAKVRSCVVMLDLECDALIVEMFKHFLKAVREQHTENVFSSMETIMTLVIEESEDIPLELLSPILDSLKKDNEEVLPIARKLGERVLECSASKLKPYLVHTVDTLGISLDNYSNVLASICQDTPKSLEQNDACATSEHVEGESKSTKEPVEESAQVVGEDAKDAEPPQQDNSIGDRSPKSVMSNGIAQAREDDALVDSKSPKAEHDTNISNQSKGINLPGKEETKDLDSGKPANSGKKVVQASKRRGRKTNTSAKSAEPSVGSHLADEKEAEKLADSKSNRKEVPSSDQDGGIEAAGPSENDKEIDTKVPSPKTAEAEADVASPSPSENMDENGSKKQVRSKKKDNSAKEVTTKEVVPNDDLKKVAEGTSDSEAKPSRRSGKKTIDRSSDGKKTTEADTDKKGSGVSGADAKKQPAKKVEESKKGSVGSSSRKLEDKKKRTRGKVNSDKGIAKSTTKDEEKELVSSPKSASKSTKDELPEETPKISAKRKRTPGKENEEHNNKDGEDLVGTRVKVWWPEDEMYYEGVIDSYDRSKKKHKVSYDDGDKEILNLKKERWEILDDADPDPVAEEVSDHGGPDASDDNDMPPEPGKKKGKASDGKKASSSRSGGAASSKSKGSSGKSNQKSKDSSKVDRKAKDNTPKTGGGKSVDAAPKASGKSKTTDGSKISKTKDDDVSASKPAAKSKQETPKTGKAKPETSKSAASKAKSARSGGKSNGTGKMKASLLQVKDSESEGSEGSTKEVEETKVKATSSSKSGTEVKSGKKRGRN
ncbi:hypothetical protein PIB30_089216 [Stylosanthes scabra]|uniref:Uncharacterized protein n=1 Tax=Stylosanthes scabra TaxID=79078 RepID=A0ABU6QTD4_9FABA|nr:hypothetical protein [Stylosanthes scabra]